MKLILFCFYKLYFFFQVFVFAVTRWQGPEGLNNKQHGVDKKTAESETSTM
jgi:hypothetical protein